jgi:hypothetical protein
MSEQEHERDHAHDHDHDYEASDRNIDVEIVEHEHDSIIHRIAVLRKPINLFQMNKHHQRLKKKRYDTNSTDRKKQEIKQQ